MAWKADKIAKPEGLLFYGLTTAALWVMLGFHGQGVVGGVLVALILSLLQLTLAAVSGGLNPQIDDRYRATILSYRGGLDRLVGLGAWSVILLVGISTGSIWLGILLAILLMITWRKG